ncbi:esterase/lipase family protein [Blastopirellula marina]|uniref:AB hydrolase-1 domain-containing protein n=1 Tax=Blastopirellula marina TaxID=124 RepID=A0A2S8GUM4_9BACT|nr:hypothetical protein [Blastopirellula marina]PQO48127.1 hypothetical protein C5Y93_00150 [Blastopirellula marina]
MIRTNNRIMFATAKIPRAARVAVVLLLGIGLLTSSGCMNARFASVRKTPTNPLDGPLQLMSYGGPKITERTRQSLRQLDLEKYADGNYDVGLSELAKIIEKEPTADHLYTYAELSYVAGTRADALGKNATALELYAGSVSHAYFYLFESQDGLQADGYDPRFRQACDIYNKSLEGSLRLVKLQGRLKQGDTYRIKTPNHVFVISLDTIGRWKDTHFQDFQFTSDYEVDGLKNQHRQYGLGVPLIAECKDKPPAAPGSDYFPPNLTFALTAFLEVSQKPDVDPETKKFIHHCRIHLYDPLEQPEIEIHGKRVPLEADISTPLAYLLDSSNMSQMYMSTIGMLSPGEQTEQSGIYMLEPYDPQKIPVMMVHGLWSSPMTWLEMFNDLRAQPEIRNNYQFWFYLYPTGQPFWISAEQFRADLNEMRAELDPNRAAIALDQMVLVGHSMGGLVSRMQTIESRNDFWHLVSDRPPSELDGDPEDTEALRNMLYFHPNQSIRRVITMGTPHRGSNFANSTTRWLGQTLIVLPSFITGSSNRLIESNPGYFRNRELLQISTSVDSLAPDSPVLPAILEAPKAPWVKYHTVIGVVDQDTWLGYFSGRSDGVVNYESARLDEAVSELVVTADHNSVHRTPKSVLEVRRILREHIQQLRQEYYTSLQIPGRSQPALGPHVEGPQTAAYHQTINTELGSIDPGSHPIGEAPSEGVMPASYVAPVEKVPTSRFVPPSTASRYSISPPSHSSNLQPPAPLPSSIYSTPPQPN